MNQPKLLKPSPGARVRKPDGSLLAEAGERLVVDGYWARRILAGDVFEAADTAPKKGGK